MKLNLGCSDALEAGYVNVDLVDQRVFTREGEPAYQQADLDAPWPWDDSTVDEIRAHDIFEHLQSKIATMNEAHRVLKPGGILDLFIPTTDGRGAFQDPTHVTLWTPNDLFYYVDCFAEWKRFSYSYGINARFRIVGIPPDDVHAAWESITRGHRQYGPPDANVWKLRVQLEAIK